MAETANLPIGEETGTPSEISQLSATNPVLEAKVNEFTTAVDAFDDALKASATNPATATATATDDARDASWRETRYWVRKIVPLKNDDTDFLQKLKAEIPAFLHFLCNRTLSTEKESRMWLDPKRLETDALRKIIRSNRNRLEIEMAELLLDIMASTGVSSVSFCLNDIIPLLVCSQVKVEKSQVRKVVQECWKLAPVSNSLSYTTYQYDYNHECHYSPVRRIGRYYTVSKVQLETL